MSGPDYIIDLSGGQSTPARPPASPSRETGEKRQPRGAPWLAVHWRCCNVYSRIYRDRSGGRYAGRCPRCGRLVSARIGAGGTTSRFFEAT